MGIGLIMDMEGWTPKFVTKVARTVDNPLRTDLETSKLAESRMDFRVHSREPRTDSEVVLQVLKNTN